MTKLYTVEEIANFFKANKQTVYNLINDGKLKAIKVGKRKLITEEALNEFMYQ